MQKGIYFDAMDLLLKGKHWQVFLLLFGLPILGIIFFLIFMVVFAETQTHTAATLVVAAVLFSFIIASAGFLIWLYYLTSKLYARLMNKANVNFGLFKVCIVMLGIFLLCLTSVLYNIADKFTGLGARTIAEGTLATVMPPLFLLATLSLFYCLYFTARALKTVELRRVITVQEYAAEFVQLWYFPLGVWILQPRINKIFSGK